MDRYETELEQALKDIIKITTGEDENYPLTLNHAEDGRYSYPAREKRIKEIATKAIYN